MSSKCAIIGKQCPKTADPAESLYCPFWVSNIAEARPAGEIELYTGCLIPKLPIWLIAITSKASHAAASYDKAANQIVAAGLGGSDPVLGAMLTAGMSAVAGRFQRGLERRLEAGVAGDRGKNGGGDAITPTKIDDDGDNNECG